MTAPAGVALTALHVPSPLRNLDASPAAGAGTMPFVPPAPVSPLTAGSIAATCAAVRSSGSAVAPVLLPLMVLAGMLASRVLVTVSAPTTVLASDLQFAEALLKTRKLSFGRSDTLP